MFDGIFFIGYSNDLWTGSKKNKTKRPTGKKRQDMRNWHVFCAQARFGATFSESLINDATISHVWSAGSQKTPSVSVFSRRFVLLISGSEIIGIPYFPCWKLAVIRRRCICPKRIITCEDFIKRRREFTVVLIQKSIYFLATEKSKGFNENRQEV